jgi:hypothetical protein
MKHLVRSLAAVMNLIMTNVIIAGSSLACELTTLRLPAKESIVDFEDGTANVRSSARLEFGESTPATVQIRESVLALILNPKSMLRSYVQRRIAQAQDDCGLTTSLGDVTTSVILGKLIVDLPFHAEQWKCLLNLKALVASGDITFRVTYSLDYQVDHVLLRYSVEHFGDTSTTIPSIDSQLSNNIQTELSEATGLAVQKVSDSLAQVQRRLQKLSDETPDPTSSAKPIYQPKTQSVKFVKSDDGIGIERVRIAETRLGTACTIRSIAITNWEEL